MGNSYNYKIEHNSLISDKNKALISNQEHESWLTEQISKLLAYVS